MEQEMNRFGFSKFTVLPPTFCSSLSPLIESSFLISCLKPILQLVNFGSLPDGSQWSPPQGDLPCSPIPLCYMLPGVHILNLIAPPPL